MSIIRISGKEWQGRTVTEMIARLANEKADPSLATRPVLVIRNGSLVLRFDCDSGRR